MRMVMMNGGLGNQAFQYIFLRYIEEQSGEPCVMDDLAFCTDKPSHNGYELERLFSVGHVRLSQMLDQDVIEEIKRQINTPTEQGQKPKSIISVFQTAGLDLFPVQEGNFLTQAYDYKGSIASTPPNVFFPDILRYTGDLYYYGYWINAHWFGSIMDKIVKEFTFPPIPDSRNQNYMSEIQSLGERSVAVHIRRGDFVDIGWAISPEYYKSALEAMRGEIEHPVFFFFSDDMSWVRENLEALGVLPSDEIIFVEGNMGGNNYIDMQLMAACRGMIICNSSFSYLAALLNRRPDKLWCNPTQREII